MDTIKIQEFNKLPKAQKRLTLSHLRKEFSDSIIAGFWGLTMEEFDNLLTQLDLPIAPPPTEGRTATVEVVNPETTKEIQLILNEYRQMFLATALPRRSGISVALDGVYDSEFLVKRLRKIASMLKGEEGNFKVTLVIEESTQPLAKIHDPNLFIIDGVGEVAVTEEDE